MATTYKHTIKQILANVDGVWGEYSFAELQKLATAVTTPDPGKPVEPNPTPDPAKPPVQKPLAILQFDFDLENNQGVFNYEGGDGTPVEFMAPGATGWTKNLTFKLDFELWQDSRKRANTLPVYARQSGKQIGPVELPIKPSGATTEEPKKTNDKPTGGKNDDATTSPVTGNSNAIDQSDYPETEYLEVRETNEK